MISRPHLFAAAALAAAALAPSVACSNASSGASGAPTSTSASAQAPSAAAPSGSAKAAAALSAIDAWIADPSAPLTPDIAQKALDATNGCAIDGDDVAQACPMRLKWSKLWARTTAVKLDHAEFGKVAIAGLASDSPAVRLKALDVGSWFGTPTPEVEKAFFAAADKETEPAVLRKLAALLGVHEHGKAASKALLVRLADHPDETTRKLALRMMLVSFNKGQDDLFDKALEKLQKDPSIDVRASVCERLYATSDPRAIGELQKLLTAKDTPDGLVSACFEGAVGAWTGRPYPDAPSQKAYELTISVLTQKPEGGKRPFLNGIDKLGDAQTSFVNDSAGEEWLKQVKPWFKRPKLVSALTAFVLDGAAKENNREQALAALKQMGEPKATFSSIETKLGKTDDDKAVHERVTALLKSF